MYYENPRLNNNILHNRIGCQNDQPLSQIRMIEKE